jgi:arsenate reductase
LSSLLHEETQRFRVLFLSFDDSARGLMAEAILNARGKGRFDGVSAGVHPTADANASAMQALRDWNVPAPEHAPRGIEGLDLRGWDFVITLSERAKRLCPAFPAGTFVTHWSTPDPAEEQRRGAEEPEAVRTALLVISRRIDLLVTLPLEKLGRMATEGSLRAIGQVYSGVGSDARVYQKTAVPSAGRLTLLPLSAAPTFIPSGFFSPIDPAFTPA